LTLIELLVFNVTLPKDGLSQAKSLIGKLPIKNDIRKLFLERMQELENITKIDVRIQSGKEVKMKGSYQ